MLARKLNICIQSLLMLTSARPSIPHHFFSSIVLIKFHYLWFIVGQSTGVAQPVVEAKPKSHKYSGTHFRSSSSFSVFYFFFIPITKFFTLVIITFLCSHIKCTYYSFSFSHHHHLLPSGCNGCWGDNYFTKTLSIILSLFAI